MAKSRPLLRRDYHRLYTVQDELQIETAFDRAVDRLGVVHGHNVLGCLRPVSRKFNRAIEFRVRRLRAHRMGDRCIVHRDSMLHRLGHNDRQPVVAQADISAIEAHLLRLLGASYHHVDHSQPDGRPVAFAQRHCADSILWQSGRLLLDVVLHLDRVRGAGGQSVENRFHLEEEGEVEG